MLTITACGSQAVPATPVSAVHTTSTTSSPCTNPSAFELSLVSNRGGLPTPIAAAAWFARHGGVPGVPAKGWRQVSRSGGTATVASGAVTLHVIEGPDRRWQVDGGTLCS